MMGDHDDSLLPPSRGDFAPTPSGLTPNTRSEAEAALTLNSSLQTESAAPTTPLPSYSGNMQSFMGVGGGNENVDGTDEAQKAYSKPPGPLRTSSTNYEKALLEARKQSSASSDLISPTTSNDPTNIIDENKVASPTATTPFPAPGQGVVPLNPMVPKGQGEAVKRAKPTGMTLGELGRQPSFNQQDFKHLHASGLMVPPKPDAGYDSGVEGTQK